MTKNLPLVLCLLATPALAQETRQLDSHEHGVGELNIAVDGSTLAMELRAPGADIVGFEYVATSAEDRSAVDAAIATLSQPTQLFVLPPDAGCSVTEASAALESEQAQHDHDADHDADHDKDHAGGHGEHGHSDDHSDEHAHDHSDEHAHDHSDEHAHDHDDEHAHDHGDDHDHAQAGGHTEFHAAYTLTCANPDALSQISFAYFDTFANALALKVQIISASGAQAFEVRRDAPVLDLPGTF